MKDFEEELKKSDPPTGLGGTVDFYAGAYLGRALTLEEIEARLEKEYTVGGGERGAGRNEVIRAIKDWLKDLQKKTR